MLHRPYQGKNPRAWLTWHRDWGSDKFTTKLFFFFFFFLWGMKLPWRLKEWEGEGEGSERETWCDERTCGPLWQMFPQLLIHHGRETARATRSSSGWTGAVADNTDASWSCSALLLTYSFILFIRASNSSSFGSQWGCFNLDRSETTELMTHTRETELMS